VIALIQFIRERGLSDGVVDGLISGSTLERTYFDKITASLLPLMEKLISGRIGELISPDYEDMNDTRPENRQNLTHSCYLSGTWQTRPFASNGKPTAREADGGRA
jgi:hypothetical protein